ncbi:MAG TPA: PIG-L family deacetylase [Planctomycetota bacterium]|nr:PIG-L family deacetylase [Planctomycetota bacterium]
MPAREEGASVFLFAHQDDEAFVAPRLSLETARGRRVVCAYLTDGSYGSDERRNRESLRYLSGLGVDPAFAFFIGTEDAIPDGRLVQHLERALVGLERRLAGARVERIFCPAWEGGHQDHDAVHLIGLALAIEWGILDATRQFYTYNGARSFGRTFNVMRPIEDLERRDVRRLSFGRGLETALSCWKFRTQWKSWVGLFPQYFLHWAFLRTEILDPVSVERTRARPHEGRLLYERRDQFTFEEFERAAAPFARKRLGAAS